MTTDDKCIAITGAHGFIGRHLCDHFRRLGWEVRGLVRDTSKYPYRESGVQLFRCDLPDTMEPKALERVRVVVHCAYMTRFTDLEAARHVNEEGTRRLLAAGKAAGVERYVFLSSQSAHEEAQSYYGRSKLELEKLFSLDRDVILRPGLVTGESGDGLYHRMCKMVQNSKVIPLFGGGRQPIQTVRVEDLCLAIQAALEKGLSGLFTIAHPRVFEMRQLLRSIADDLGKKPIFLPFPMAPALLALRLIEGLHIPFPVSSENLIGMKCLRATDTTEDWSRLGIQPGGIFRRDS